MSREAKILREALDKIYANAAESPEWIRNQINTCLQENNR